MLGENYLFYLILARRELDKYKNIRFDKFKLIYRYKRNNCIYLAGSGDYFIRKHEGMHKKACR